jgi:hypothetical protein
MLIGIGDLEWKRVKNASQRPESLFIGTHKSVNLTCLLCTNGGEKDPMPFTKVVEQCKIYNFGIQMFAHFSSKILRKTLLNEATPKGLAPSTCENAGARDVAPSHVGFVIVRHRTRTSRPARIRWSIRRAPFFHVRDASRPVVGATRQTPTRR